MSYVKLYVHCVWCTKNRECIISNSFRPIVISHIKEYCESKDIYLDFINIHKDHVHALISLGKKQSVADVMFLLKGESSHWINNMKMLPYHFIWQDDYYAASVSYSHVDNVRNYIKNQDEHHKEKTLDEEVNRFLLKNGFERIKDLL